MLAVVITILLGTLLELALFGCCYFFFRRVKTFRFNYFQTAE